MAMLQTNGINLYYDVHGKGDPIVLIAGFSVDHTGWLPVIDLLSPHYRVIVLDNRGIGQSDSPLGSYTIDRMAQDVVALLDSLSLSQAHIIGSSMGGMIAQQLAGHYSDRVKSLIVVNSVSQIDERNRLWFQTWYELLQYQVPMNLIAKGLFHCVFSSQFLSHPKQITHLLNNALENPKPFSLAAFQSQFAALTAFNSTEWLHQINQPCLIIGSDEDGVFPQRQVRKLAETIKGARYLCFEQCGHVPFIEYPEKFTAQVNAFLRSTRS